jgi:hypothetical protein
MGVMIEIRKYRQTRFWGVYVDGLIVRAACMA